MTRSPRPFADVPRLLLKRRDFQTLGDKRVASSVTAFLAWKAYLVVAKGALGECEKGRCAELTATVLGAFPTVWESLVGPFLDRLWHLRKETDVVLAEWYCDDAWSENDRDRRVEWARRSLRKARDEFARGDRNPELAKLVAAHAHATRNAVIGHASVLSTAQLFQLIVPSFENLVCGIACGGYAIRAGIEFPVAQEECGVQV